MKTSLHFMLPLLFACSAWAQPVTVYDLTVDPDSPNKKVTVTYRLAETASGYADVEVGISSNAGETWSVPAQTFYPGSDVGAGIPANGTARQFVWDARADWNEQYSTQMIVRVTATQQELGSRIYLTVGNDVYRLNTDGSGFALVASGASGTQFIFADMANSKLYMPRWGSGSQVMVFDTLTEGNVQTLFSGPGSDGGQGIAYDPATSNYFVGLYYNGLYVMNPFDGRGWCQLVSSTDLSPTYGLTGQIALDTNNRHVYFRTSYNGWCDQCRSIWRVGYDGAGLTQLVPANGGGALAVDVTGGHIYFSDEPGDGTIKRANLDGSGVVTLATLPSPYSYCSAIELDVPAGKMYISAYEEPNADRKRAVVRLNLDGSGHEVLKGAVPGLEGGFMALFKYLE